LTNIVHRKVYKIARNFGATFRNFWCKFCYKFCATFGFFECNFLGGLCIEFTALQIHRFCWNSTCE